ncbi:lipocalin family protein [Photobacterium sp. SDRW27]|uniref:lipocalin family protein n=1 Tax=Photobacterium obscurum TaxID=2829490 RepID=UPI002242ED4B|nr:lipocalin family protein [Photobacterium obscurum]MCW8327349.1 lipocalin family protein [Photobacterium obscurum]
MRTPYHWIAILIFTILTGCTGMPERVTPVENFQLNRYLGTWYEIARLDHRFERGLTQVSATYSLNDDGSVKVINKGFNHDDNEWKEAEGKAKFVNSPDIGHLKVSFFGPFYGSYVIFFLETDYSTALVSGYNTDYFWILSRHPQLDHRQIETYKAIARQAGFNTNKLIFPATSDLIANEQ